MRDKPNRSKKKRKKTHTHTHTQYKYPELVQIGTKHPKPAKTYTKSIKEQEKKKIKWSKIDSKLSKMH